MYVSLCDFRILYKTSEVLSCTVDKGISRHVTMLCSTVGTKTAWYEEKLVLNVVGRWLGVAGGVSWQETLEQYGQQH